MVFKSFEIVKFDYAMIEEPCPEKEISGTGETDDGTDESDEDESADEGDEDDNAGRLAPPPDHRL